ncbi:cell adhesion molecule CEACAM5 [Chaetodon trifascialis]|uniref:cell adhesion molecule CEACAM5 n=1 Tax=Chaetodon trifascialis TaxID=109706 RepID=UPI003991CEF5
MIPTVYEPPVPILQLQSTWLDVFPSEKVVFNCNIHGSSDWTFTWFRNDQEVQDSDPNVSLSADQSVLTITAATQTYSGHYSCKGHHKTKGVTTASSLQLKLTVSAKKPKPTLSRSSNFDKMFPGESVTFTCTVTVASGWEYLWYHNGTDIQAPNSNTYTIASIDHPNSGQYHCKAKRGKGPFYTEESEKTTLQVSDPPKPSMRLLTPWTDVFENETVEFRCEVDSSDWKFSWYRNKELLEEDVILSLLEVEPSLNVTSITHAYQGGYACKVHLGSRRVSSGFSNTVDITVYENIPKPTLRKSPGFNPMYVGETVNFTCNVDVSSGWVYQWYKDGRVLPETNKTISIHLNPTNRGKYSCMATRSETTSTHISEEIQQDVLEIPVPSVKQLRPWLDVFPTERVKLSCGLNDSSEWIYTWSKDGQLVQADNIVSFDSNGATLSISSASAAHAGQYNCKGHLKDRSVSRSSDSGLTLTVYDKGPTFTVMQDPDYQLMFSGESVSFSCHINVSSGWEYRWYRDGNFLNSGNTYTISPIGTADQGSYECEAKRGENDFSKTSTAIHLEVQKNKPKPSMTQQPYADKVYTGESVSFKCKVDLSSGWEYLWYKDGTKLSVINSNFNIHNASSLNNGVYQCMAIRNKPIYNTEHSIGRTLHIFEIPVPSLKQQTPWLDVFPTESVKLSCGMDGSSDWKYIWNKDGKSVGPDNIVSFDSDRTTLSISSASTSHSGQYTCSGILKSRSVRSSFSSALQLHVNETKPVILTQSPSHNVMHTEDFISFYCHINVSSGWEYLWYKDDSLLTESGKNYNISSALTRNSGSYKCQTKRGTHTVFHSDQSQAVRLNIQERPKAAIILLTGWSEVFSTDSLVLKCGVQESQDTWNYTWFKEDQPINVTLRNEKYIVTPQNDPKQSQYTCRGFRTGRPSYSKTSDQFKTKNLLLKRRVLLSISGFIFFGIIAVFLGCIVLRVIRKPAVDEYKPEEADLFVSMALKDRDDTPCPLVEYITDAALNSPPKEGNENGMVCSETTPLPISSQEDQAVTAESHDATENNGGLVSFQK